MKELGGMVCFSEYFNHYTFSRIFDDTNSFFHRSWLYVVDRENLVVLSIKIILLVLVMGKKIIFTHLNPPFSDWPPGKTRDTKMPVSFASYLSAPLYIKDKP